MERRFGKPSGIVGKIGVKVRNFCDPSNPNMTGGILEVPDMKVFEEFLATDEVHEAIALDGFKFETIRMLTEFSP